MRQSQWAPSIVPNGEDQTVYLVLDDFGHIGQAWRETDVKDTELETAITDLLEGQYNNPVQIIGLNTAEGWARDVSGQSRDFSRAARKPRPQAANSAPRLTALATRPSKPTDEAMRWRSDAG